MERNPCNKCNKCNAKKCNKCNAKKCNKCNAKKYIFNIKLIIYPCFFCRFFR